MLQQNHQSPSEFAVSITRQNFSIQTRRTNLLPSKGVFPISGACPISSGHSASFRCLCCTLHSASGESIDHLGSSIHRYSGFENIKKSCMLDKTMQAPETVGAFQKLPMVMPAMDILSSAKKKGKECDSYKGYHQYCKTSEK
ncbi:hypothetical protein HPP92_008755 [Vanilla planifolia]|uniref:Uncharacterized protein n=1 Tax=Vanilla planifolia TaxID=51239 RepID=A0A835REL8_VANPL|nr:hypothetical protein HPP92_008755 [Vanilla planifolia]